jgi:hypothetical protein
MAATPASEQLPTPTIEKGNSCCISNIEGDPWQDTRVKLVEQALADSDYGGLRRISSLPGGYGTNEMRQKVW